ncbi:hypothetical protein B566_EDAN006542 [Ephemera danica]|nr:hypothetical protein B566_EDAN006542 [Ephemera danica]
MRLGGSLGSQGLDMSKPLLNGSSTSDVDAAEEDAATMVAAIQDHIASCTKLQDTGYTGIEIKEERFPCDFDHMYASMAEHDSAAVVMEVRQLKELLLCHLDLIQQQSEQLVNKDKQLQNLRQENEMLRQRLERMDRRVTLHHNKRQSGDPPTVGGTPNSGVFPLDTGSPSTLSEVPGTGSEDDGGSLSMQPFPKAECSLSPRGSPLTVNSGANQQPQQSQQQQPQQQQQSQTLALPEQRASRSRKSSWSSDTGTAASRRSGGSIAGSEMRETRSRAGTPNTNTSSSISKRLRTSNRRPASQNEAEQPCPEVPEPDGMKPKLSSSVSAVRTPVLYYCPGEATIAKPKVEGASSQALLEVPSWRIRPYTSCYSMEGTENLEDEVFLKRHTRLELDERRRKRWDIQRLREQRQYEKLRQRQMQQQQQQQQAGTGGRRGVANRRNNQQPDESELWPDPENVQFIEVDEFLPVTAFGVPVPAFLPTLFELSWSIGKEHVLDQDPKVNIKQEPKEDNEVTPAPPPPSPDLPPPPPPQNPPASRNRRRSRATNCERRRTSARRR